MSVFGSTQVAMTRTLFGLRYGYRLLANVLLPRLIGPRDRLCHYDTQAPWVPDQPLDAFVREAARAQTLHGELEEIGRFLDFWLPVQILSTFDRALIELSLTTNKPGLGFMLYGDNLSMTRAFADYCRRVGIYCSAADLCLAICDTFRGSDMGMVRAELIPGGPTRYSIASSWQFDVLRGNRGFEDKLARLPARFRDQVPLEQVRACSGALAPDYYPLFLGLSFLADGALESKMYLVRFDHEQSPFHPGSRLWRFIEGMELPARELERLKALSDMLWASSMDKMTQIAIEVSAAQATPKRLNLIYCGTKLSAIKAAIERFGLDRTSGQSVDAFARMMQHDFAKFVGIRVTPRGISPRIKLYGHAMFALSGLSGLHP